MDHPMVHMIVVIERVNLRLLRQAAERFREQDAVVVLQIGRAIRFVGVVGAAQASRVQQLGPVHRVLSPVPVGGLRPKKPLGSGIATCPYGVVARGAPARHAQPTFRSAATWQLGRAGAAPKARPPPPRDARSAAQTLLQRWAVSGGRGRRFQPAVFQLVVGLHMDGDMHTGQGGLDLVLQPITDVMALRHRHCAVDHHVELHEHRLTRASGLDVVDLQCAAARAEDHRADLVLFLGGGGLVHQAVHGVGDHMQPLAQDVHRNKQRQDRIQNRPAGDQNQYQPAHHPGRRPDVAHQVASAQPRRRVISGVDLSAARSAPRGG